MKKLLFLAVATFSLQALACTPASTTGKPLTPEEARRICSNGPKPLPLGHTVMSVVRVANLQSELSELMIQHNDRVQKMNQLVMNDLPQRYAIEQLLFQRNQHISRMVYLQNLLAGPLYPNQRYQANFELEQLMIGLRNGDMVLNVFISNYNFMYNQFWTLNKEAADIQKQIQAKQVALAQAIEQQKKVEPTPQRLAELEAEKVKLEKSKERLLALAKEAETTAQRAKDLQNQSGGLVDELSETLNWNK